MNNQLEDYADKIEETIQKLQDKDDLDEVIIVIKTYSGSTTTLIGAAADTCAITAARLLHIVGSQQP